MAARDESVAIEALHAALRIAEEHRALLVAVIDEVKSERDAARMQVERMRPIVQVAEAMTSSAYPEEEFSYLFEAVQRYWGPAEVTE